MLEILEKAIRVKGYAPSVRELAESLSITVTATVKHLQGLTRKGFIRREIATWRAVRLTDDGVREMRRRD